MRQMLLVVTVGLVFLTGCMGGSVNGSNQIGASQSGPSGATLAGTVHGGQAPIVGAHVYLLAANTANTFVPENAAVPVANGQTSIPVLTYNGVGDGIGPYVTTDANGDFNLTGLYTCTPGQQVYLYSLGGNPGGGGNSSWVSLMAVLGTCPGTGNFGSIPFITVNEVTTIAAAYAMADFATDPTHVWITGTTPSQSGVVTAFANAANLANLGTGAALTSPAPQAEIDTLANILAACLNSTSFQSTPCSTLFDNAQPPQGPGFVYPQDTATTAINIAHYPTANTAALYSIANSVVPFLPSLPSQPVDFTIPLAATPTPAPYFKDPLNSTTVFMGDSITAYWNLPVNNQGIAGEFTQDMLNRFQADVINPGIYTRVVILAGTNDIYLAQSPNIPQAVANVETMAGMARAAGIEVILCTLPANETNPGFFAPLYSQFNGPITTFATTTSTPPYPLVDYYDLTYNLCLPDNEATNPTKPNCPDYYLDGLHPNQAGYAAMEGALAAMVTQ